MMTMTALDSHMGVKSYCWNSKHFRDLTITDYIGMYNQAKPVRLEKKIKGKKKIPTKWKLYRK